MRSPPRINSLNRLCSGQGEDKDGSAALSVPGKQLSAVGPGDPLAHTQTKACPTRFGGEMRFEQTECLLLGKARPLIFHLETDTPPRSLFSHPLQELDLDLDYCLRGGRLQGVHDEIQGEPFEPFRLTPHNCATLARRHDANRLLRRTCGAEDGNLPREIAQVDQLGGCFAFGLGVDQQTFDQSVDPLQFTDHDLKELGLRVFGRKVIPKDFSRPANGRRGRLDVVEQLRASAWFSHPGLPSD
jgi:hypothetical protein